MMTVVYLVLSAALLLVGFNPYVRELNPIVSLPLPEWVSSVSLFLSGVFAAWFGEELAAGRKKPRWIIDVQAGDRFVDVYYVQRSHLDAAIRAAPSGGEEGNIAGEVEAWRLRLLGTYTTFPYVPPAESERCRIRFFVTGDGAVRFGKEVDGERKDNG